MNQRVICRSALSVAMVLAVVSGCTSDQRAGRSANVENHTVLSEGYTLLHVLLKKQSNVDKIFLIKGGEDTFKGVIKQIAQVSSDGAKQIGEFAEADEMIGLEGGGLPVIEAAARDGIESQTTDNLLGSGREELQVRLSIEQMKATRYGAHLARALAERDTNTERVEFLRVFADEYDTLHDRLLELVAPVR